MKCTVIYFSQTGCTEQVAKAIQVGVGDAAGHCDLFTIREANPLRLYEYDLIGLGCPIHAGGEPPNVRAFIKSMRFVGGKHVFVFFTHGCHPDSFPSTIVPKLKRRGLTYIGIYSCYAPGYLSIKPDPYPTAGHPDEIDLKEAVIFGREMVELSRRISSGETSLIPPTPGPPEPWSVEMMAKLREEFGKGVPPVKDHFKIYMKFHKEKCIYPECRLCMENCPMDGIDLSMDPPVITKPCEGCGFCAKICPTGALDDSAWIEAIGPRMNEMMKKYYLPFLDKAEKEGRFRRLVPIDEIGWDTPIYKKHSNHPQWVIGKGFQ